MSMCLPGLRFTEEKSANDEVESESNKAQEAASDSAVPEEAGEGEKEKDVKDVDEGKDHRDRLK